MTCQTGMSGKDSKAAWLWAIWQPGMDWQDWLFCLAAWHGLASLAAWHGGWAGLAGLAAGQARHAGIEEARLPGCKAKLGWLCIAGMVSLAVWQVKLGYAWLDGFIGTSCIAAWKACKGTGRAAQTSKN